MWRVIRPDAFEVLSDTKCRASLSRYFQILEGEKYSKLLIAKRTPADFNRRDPIERLWMSHEKSTEAFMQLEKKVDRSQAEIDEIAIPEKSYFDLKIEIASRILASCHFCSRRCGANRLEGKLGVCRCSDRLAVSSFFEHAGEEPELVPSGTVFTCGCPMRCLHCQNWSISQWYEEGDACSAEDAAKIVEKLKRNGCRNANLVGGDPTPWLKQWLEAFKLVNSNIPVVWNSNSYYSDETAKLLAGFADIYLLDFKYGSNECAVRISNAPEYLEAARRSHLYALKYGELIIRILLLPSHIECCAKPILKWIAENLGTGVRVNIMDQYRPEWRAHEIPELRRRLLMSEYKEAVEYAKKLNITNLA